MFKFSPRLDVISFCYEGIAQSSFFAFKDMHICIITNFNSMGKWLLDSTSFKESLQTHFLHLFSLFQQNGKKSISTSFQVLNAGRNTQQFSIKILYPKHGTVYFRDKLWLCF